MGEAPLGTAESSLASLAARGGKAARATPTTNANRKILDGIVIAGIVHCVHPSVIAMERDYPIQNPLSRHFPTIIMIKI
jgi:hypothetical protein